jgi:hypothetical protein
MKEEENLIEINTLIEKTKEENHEIFFKELSNKVLNHDKIMKETINILIKEYNNLKKEEIMFKKKTDL